MTVENCQSSCLPWPEHPRPDFYRDAWQNLNGTWAFDFDEEDKGLAGRWFEKHEFSRAILVPFCYQSEKSGIHDLKDHEVMWYQRTFKLEKELQGKRCRLHFGAVDYEAYVWLDGCYLGAHEGGYTPFSFDITDMIRHIGEDKTHTLTVRAVDRLSPTQPRGKQSWLGKPFECWYTPVSGIWQTVYLEAEGNTAISAIHFTPDISQGCARSEITLSRIFHGKLAVQVQYQGDSVFACEYEVQGQEQFPLTLHLSKGDPIEGIHLWRPGHPALYDVTITLTDPDGGLDTIHTYFGMRDIQVKNGMIYLNGSVLYQKLVLDQGYWPDTLLTPPDDESLRADVEWALKLGYNGARKHQKIELPRYYYWADKLGLLVWGELPSTYRFTSQSQDRLHRDMAEFIRRDYNHPSLIVWVPLNESWGVRWIGHDQNMQRFADSLYARIKAMDSMRLISNNDGWEQPNSDIFALHDYTAYGQQLSGMYATREQVLTCGPMRVRATLAKGYQDHGQPIILSEYGGIAMSRDAKDNHWGYNGAVDTEENFLARFENITRALCAHDYILGYCYTQLTDVFQEVNGLLDMHRNPKVDVDKIRTVNDSIRGI